MKGKYSSKRTSKSPVNLKREEALLIPRGRNVQLSIFHHDQYGVIQARIPPNSQGWIGRSAKTNSVDATTQKVSFVMHSRILTMELDNPREIELLHAIIRLIQDPSYSPAMAAVEIERRTP